MNRAFPWKSLNWIKHSALVIISWEDHWLHTPHLSPQIIITPPLRFVHYLELGILLKFYFFWSSFELQYNFINTLMYLLLWFIYLNYNKMHMNKQHGSLNPHSFLLSWLLIQTLYCIHTMLRLSQIPQAYPLEYCNSPNTVNKFNYFLKKNQCNSVDNIDKVSHIPIQSNTIVFTVFVNGFEGLFDLLLSFSDSGDTIILIFIEEMIGWWFPVTCHKILPKLTGVLFVVTGLGSFFACLP